MKKYFPFSVTLKIHAGIFSLVFNLLCFQHAAAQIDATAGSTAIELAEAIAGTGIDISGATATCHNNGKGIFECIDCNVGIDSGIVLTSGKAILVEGPNDLGSEGFITSYAGDANLDELPGVSTTYDACVLEFDLVPISDTITFDYVFGSEEYLEYVGFTFNDVFAFFISGPGITGTKNIALVPGSSVPVSIATINTTWNPTYYNDNGTGYTLPYSGDNYYIQYDGFTDVLQAKSAVIPCETYHLKLAVADVYDQVYDSGVFIKANSLNANMDFTVGGVLFSSGDTVYVAPGVPVDLEVFGPAGFTFFWSPPAGLTTTTGSTTSATIYSATTYTIIATDCGTFTGTITLIPDPLVLSVELSYFNALCTDENIIVNWNTSSEINLKEFILEKSMDAENYSAITTIPAEGFSSDIIQYFWIDEDINSQSSYYRLKQVDNNNGEKYSETIHIDCGVNTNTFEIYTASIKDDILFLSANVPADAAYIICLYDATGRNIFQHQIELIKGSNKIEINCNLFLPDEFYITTITDNDKISCLTKPVIKMK
ncbi:MAG: choice-of-anchor L domain-containing protein [Fimbriimonadaceae bacterium]|nr:choice-of-anchor L domain-containing protein [Chitinophagales bacterium]